MTTITEDYVSFETAKLLNDKGFGEPTIGTYNIESKNPILIERPIRAIHCEAIVSAPTLQMAMKWLREVHKIFIETSVSIDLNGKYHYRYSILNRKCEYIRKGYTDFDWNYEEAIEEAIKYCLKHLI